MSNPVNSSSPKFAEFSDESHLRKVAPDHQRTVGKVKEAVQKHKLTSATPDISALMGRMDVFEEFSLDAEPAKEDHRKRSKTEPGSDEAPTDSILSLLKAVKKTE
ncbi:MAG: hypothetical protein K1X28_10255 [Parachlamydiales bacterium]|nr:hypothetical protein [Parachlamydiales bacterium]